MPTSQSEGAEYEFERVQFQDGYAKTIIYALKRNHWVLSLDLQNVYIQVGVFLTQKVSTILHTWKLHV